MSNTDNTAPSAAELWGYCPGFYLFSVTVTWADGAAILTVPADNRDHAAYVARLRVTREQGLASTRDAKAGAIAFIQTNPAAVAWDKANER
jgi:hypothetical protein